MGERRTHLLEMNRGAAEILREASCVSFHQAEVVVGLGQPLGRRERVPPSRLSKVLAHPQTILVCYAWFRRRNDIAGAEGYTICSTQDPIYDVIRTR